MNTRIDYEKETYNPSLHSNAILNEIIKFNSIESNLVMADGTALLSWGGTAGLMLMISAGFFSWLVIGTIFYLGKDQIAGREEHRQKFFEQGLELLRCYRWCLRTGGDKITFDDTFLTLLETIAIYVPDGKKLLPSNGEYSTAFKKIMSQAPHCMQFEEKKAEVSFYSMVASMFFKSNFPPVQAERKPKDQPEWITSLKYRFYKISEEKKPESKDQLSHLVVSASTTISNLLTRGIK